MIDFVNVQRGEKMCEGQRGDKFRNVSVVVLAPALEIRKEEKQSCGWRGGRVRAEVSISHRFQSRAARR